jgi:hypothetical protein
LCRLRLHSLSEYSSKQENEKKRKAKDRSEQESNLRLEKVRGKAVEHRFLILTAGEVDRLGRQAREEQSPSEFATTKSAKGGRKKGTKRLTEGRRRVGGLRSTQPCATS